MHHHYKDVRERIVESPKWFDECAVPRYCDFAPDEAANICSTRVALVLIQCQSCGRGFKVCFSTGSMEQYIGNTDLWQEIKDGALHYGDPPNVQCCPAGPTMNCLDIQVLEAWEKEGIDWQRKPEYEIALPDSPLND